MLPTFAATDCNRRVHPNEFMKRENPAHPENVFRACRARDLRGGQLSAVAGRRSTKNQPAEDKAFAYPVDHG